MKSVIFLGDGMSDHPHERLDGRTPLQVANKPWIDRIAREGLICSIYFRSKAFFLFFWG